MPPTNYEPRLVAVPAEPGGPLAPYTAPLSARPARPRGAGGPNFTFADLAVLVVGVVALVWGLVAGWPVLVLVLASLITVVGLVLQVRKLVAWRRAATAPRAPPGDDRLVASEPVLLLDVADPTTARLVGAYRGLAAVLAGDDGPFAGAALTAGHRGLTEAAELVEGQPPASLADLEHLDRRSAAMEALAAAIRAHGSAPLPDTGRESATDAVTTLEQLRAALGPT